MAKPAPPSASTDGARPPKRGGPAKPAAAASPRTQAGGQLALAAGTLQLVDLEGADARERALRFDSEYWLDLSLASRAPQARACYRERWSAHRYERLGPIFMVPCGHALHLKHEGPAQSSIVFRLKAAAMRDWFGGDIDWTDRRLEASLDIANADIRNLLRKMVHEMRYPGLASAAMAELLAGQIAIELGRYFSAVDAPAALGGLAPWRLRLIDERAAEARKAPTVSELAALCNMSTRQLARGFRASRGCSVGDHILQARIDTAKRLLAGDDSIGEIAAQLGFSSPSSFSLAFRRDAGVSPRAYRTRALRRGGRG